MGGCPQNLSLTTTIFPSTIFSPEKVSLGLGGAKGPVRGAQKWQGCLRRGNLQAGGSVEAWFGIGTKWPPVPPHGDESKDCGHLDSSRVS